MNVLDTVFPDASTLLCEYHIESSVREKCMKDYKVKDLKSKDGKEIKSSEVVKRVMVVWEAIVNSVTKELYIDNCNRLKVVCYTFPKFLEYVETTILGSVKEKVLKFWINQVMHMGNNITNRVESAQNRLKKYMTSSMSDLSINRKSVHNMLELQHTRIHALFQTSMIMLEHGFKGKLLWYRLIRNISRNTLHYLVDEDDRAVGCGLDKSMCGCFIFFT